jgi:hypothetical protein
MANTSIVPRHLRVACGNATAAQVNAGTVIVPERADRQVVVVGGWLRALGGNAAGATSVDITDTAASPVTVAATAVGSLTQNTLVSIAGANMGAGLTAGKGLRIGKTGSSLTGATSVDYCIWYAYV